MILFSSEKSSTSLDKEVLYIVNNRNMLALTLPSSYKSDKYDTFSESDNNLTLLSSKKSSYSLIGEMSSSKDDSNTLAFSLPLSDMIIKAKKLSDN